MVKSKTQELQEKNQELINDIQRIQAEFENYRKREETNKKELIETAAKNLIQEILPVLDTFELAINATQEKTAKQGMEMIYTQLYSILHEHGLTKIQNEHEEFNPAIHEAILIEDSEEDNKILEVMMPGYKIGDKIVRHAKVKISRRKAQ